jgi:hypothetical protein
MLLINLLVALWFGPWFAHNLICSLLWELVFKTCPIYPMYIGILYSITLKACWPCTFNTLVFIISNLFRIFRPWLGWNSLKLDIQHLGTILFSHLASLSSQVISGKQFALSSIEAKYMALMKPNTKTIWICHLLIDLGFLKDNTHTTLFCDSRSTITSIDTIKFHDWTKHIDIQFHYIGH